MTNGKREPRAIQTGPTCYLPVTVPFTGVADEEPNPAFTGEQIYDLDLIGGITDLNTAQAQFKSGRNSIWSDEPFPLRTLLGKPNSARPIVYWTRPLPLLRGRRVEADFVNAGGEGAGTVVFLGEPRGKTREIEGGVRSIGEMDVIKVDAGFLGVASELKPVETTVRTSDFLLLGMHTNLEVGSLRIIDADGTWWMKDFTKIWALASDGSAAMPIQYLPRGYIIPAGQSMSFEFLNDASAPATGGSIWLMGQLLATRSTE